ncbi:MAG: hypothetical protein ABL949_10690 [Fimbriimonadaceae bacterium]
MVCPRCAKDNDQENQFCARCGLEFAKVAAESPPKEGDQFCYKHPKVSTNLSCGKCERPICTKCVMMGPAGIRCRECGKMKVAVSARGVAHDAARPFADITAYFRRNPYLLLILIPMLFGYMRGCTTMCNQVEPIPPVESPQKQGGE